MREKVTSPLPPSSTVTVPPARTAGPELAVGAVLSRYVIVSRLGAGSGGVVYAAFDTRLNRRVGLKVLRGSPSDIAPGQSGGPGWKRLVREAQLIASLDHPHVITVHDLGIEDDHTFIAMELVEGQDLAEWLQVEPPERWKERARPLALAGEALTAAHDAGVIHGDFKPANVLLGHDGRVRVTDFGVALLRDAQHEPATITGGEGSGFGTQDFVSTEEPEDPEGQLWGTPLYAAPEIFENGRPSVASDIYSFCASLYEAIWQQSVVPSANLMALYAAKLEPIRTPRYPVIPCRLESLLMAGLDPDPARRPQSLRPIVEALRSAVEPRSRRWALPLAAGLVLAGFGGAWLLAKESSECRSGEQHLVGIWDDGRRAEVREALLEAGIPHADLTWAGFEATVDAYAHSWVRAHQQTCLATKRGEQSEVALDRTMACLRARRAELAALIDGSSSGDPTVLARASAAASSLSPIETCADSTVVDDPWHTSDPRITDSVATLRAELGRVRTHYALTQDEQGLELARGILQQAEALEFAPLQAEALRWVGRLEARDGDLEAAEQHLERAAMLAEEHRVDDVAAEAWIDLMSLYMFQHDDSARAMALAPHIEVALRRADLGARPHSRFLRVRAYARFATGDREGAKQDLDATTQALREAGESPALRIELLQTVAELHRMNGELEQAAEFYRQYRDLARDHHGPAHPEAIVALENLAEILQALEQWDEGRALQEESLKLARETLGPQHPTTLSILLNHANALTALSEFEAANEAFEEAAEGYAATLGTEHPRYAGVLANHAASLGKAGRAAEAARVAEQAVTLLERKFGPDHPWLGSTQASLGIARLRSGDAAGALAPLREGLALQEKYGVPPADLAALQFVLAQAQLELGDEQDAAKSCRHALQRAATDPDLTQAIEDWMREQDL